MRVKPEMIAIQETSTTQNSYCNEQPYSGILSEKSAIILCGLGVAMFAIPILVIIQVVSGLYWGGTSIYQLLSGSAVDKLDAI